MGATPPPASANVGLRNLAKQFSAEKNATKKAIISGQISRKMNARFIEIGGMNTASRMTAWASLRKNVPPGHPRFSEITGKIKTEIRKAAPNGPGGLERILAMQRNLKLNHTPFMSLPDTKNIQRELNAALKLASSAARTQSMYGRPQVPMLPRGYGNLMPRGSSRGYYNNNNGYGFSRSRGGSRGYSRRDPYDNNNGLPRSRGGGSLHGMNYSPRPNAPRSSSNGFPGGVGGMLGSGSSAAMAAFGNLPPAEKAAVTDIGGIAQAQNVVANAGGPLEVAKAVEALNHASGNAEVAKMYSPGIAPKVFTAIKTMGGPAKAANVVNALEKINKAATSAKKKTIGTKKKVSKRSQPAPPPVIILPRLFGKLISRLPKDNLERIAIGEFVGTRKKNAANAVRRELREKLKASLIK